MTIERIFEKFEEKRHQIDISIEKLRKELFPYKNKIVLYGAGSAGIAFLHYLNDADIFPVCFSDGDETKQGKKCEGLNIISPQDIISLLGKDVLVIVTINTDGQHYCRDFKQTLLKNGHQGVHKMLEDCGCEHVIDYVYFRQCFSLYEGGNYNLPACADVHLMVAHRLEIEEAYALMVDDLSRETYLKILEYRVLGTDTNIPIVSEKKQYFEYELFPKIEDEILVDCGACGGSSLKIFLKETGGKFRKYYGIEPDEANYEKLQEYVLSLPTEVQEKITIDNVAVYNSDTWTNFFVLGGPGTFASEKGPNRVKTMKIDSLLKGSSTTYIKMNIEGSEIPALQGAEETIKRYSPRLAIMGYHKTSDFWEVPLLINKYDCNYKISLRSYMKNIAFCYFASKL